MSGTPASTAAPNGVSGARSTSGSTRKRWRSAPPIARQAICQANLPRGEITEITGSHIGDAPVLPDLLSQRPMDEAIGSVTADGAYDTRKCHDAIADRGAHAVIPPHKNARPWKTVTAGAVARNEALRASKYLGRALWRPLSGHRVAMPCRAVDGADTTTDAASRQRCTV